MSEKILKPIWSGSPTSMSGSVTKKRKRMATSTPTKQVINLDDGEDDQEIFSPSKKKKKMATPKKANDEEKRLRRYRQKAPASYLEKLNRATTQR